MKRIAINGYGRIGRNVHRQLLEHYSDSVEVVGVNASSTAEMRAYLLKFDSLHGKFSGSVEVKDDDTMVVNGKDVRIVKERDPEKCPWKELGVDIVIESTGHFTTAQKAGGHLEAGASRVIVTAPMKDDTPTFVLGINDEGLTGDMSIISNASCTTNCIAPVIKVIHEKFGVKNLLVNSVHAFTASQNLLDNKGEGNDLRRARAATLSIIPTKTGAVKACAKIFPELQGKIDGMAFRVPVPTVSCSYMAFVLEKDATVDEINATLKDAAKKDLKAILAVCDEQCVSIDFQTDPHSSIVDATFTKVVDGNTVQLLSWYDNEWGYAMRVTELLQKVISFMK
ncbi:MAG: type I glyceraldehyde-3-phosphate dehydrogenase [Candidatus Peribacteraceae bacterium]|jgi:glyceraldehyde 3-phosphate dehydrogenase|nr:type I glyceraldehyde-3-phosphate dehydrogenase [bacterium]MDP6561321.1 type I glyceraldehyde-3-phosphate dehydrogenase [Candidatus Peribacteraceae bacterium]|tara:strand:+ start:12453 stop:13469 length:1017 start_codon:yes stop_codon:yes gene_type:complete